MKATAGRLLFVFVISLCPSLSLANSSAVPIDSTGVEVRHGVQGVLHQVETGETLYAISKHYGVTVEKLQEANPELAGDAISIGQILFIPRRVLTQQPAQVELTAKENTGTPEVPEQVAAEESGGEDVQDEVLASPKTIVGGEVLRTDGGNQVRQRASSMPAGSRQHEVQAGETLFSLSRHYMVSLLALIEANPGVADKPLSTGQKLLIPASQFSLVQAAQTEEPALNLDSLLAQPQPRYHEVQQGQTLFAITAMYESAESPAQIRTWNRLVDNNVQPGQRLIVGWDRGAGSLKDARSKATWVTLGPVDTANGPRITDRGIATWLDNSSGTGAEFLALHDSAPLGGIVRVKNLMNNRTVRARVIGRLPANLDDQDAIVKLSFAAADALGAHDPRVLVEVDYASDADSDL